MAAGTEGTWMSLNNGAYPAHLEQKAYDKELRRLEALRDITVNVVPAPPNPTNTPFSPTEAAALDFEPFTLTLCEEQTLGTLAKLCKANLPDDGPGYEFRAGRQGGVEYRVSERSVGMVNAIVGRGEMEVEVRVSVAPPPGYRKEEKGKGKGLLGRLGLR